MCFFSCVLWNTRSFLFLPLLAALCVSQLKSKIMTENSIACCLATYTRKPHYIRSHEGHVHACAHPPTHTHAQYDGVYASLKPNPEWLKNRNTSYSLVHSIFITEYVDKNDESITPRLTGRTVTTLYSKRYFYYHEWQPKFSSTSCCKALENVNVIWLRQLPAKACC